MCLKRKEWQETTSMARASLCLSVPSFAREEEGSSLIETALSLLVFLVVFFGIIDVSRALYADHYVAYASRQAVRYAMVRGSSWAGTGCATSRSFDCDATDTDVQTFVKSLVPPGVIASKIAVTTVWSGKSPAGTPCLGLNGPKSPGCGVQVQVVYPYTSLIPFLPATTFVFKSTATVIIAQ